MPTKSKKISKIIKKTAPGVLISTCLVAILSVGLFCVALFPPSKMVADTYDGDPGVTPEITDGMTLQQNFFVNQDYDFFGLYFPNYLNFFREGKVFVEVTDEDHQSTQFEYEARKLINESYLYVKYPLQKDQKYTLKIWVQNIPKEKVFNFSTVSNDELQDTLTINGKKQDGVLLMTFVYSKKNYFVMWYFVLGITLSATYIVLFSKKEFYEKKK